MPGGAGHAWLSRRHAIGRKPWLPFEESVSGRTRVYAPSVTYVCAQSSGAKHEGRYQPPNSIVLVDELATVDPDDAIFSHHGGGAGSIAEEFKREGVYFLPARKGERVAGWETIRPCRANRRAWASRDARVRLLVGDGALSRQRSPADRGRGHARA